MKVVSISLDMWSNSENQIPTGFIQLDAQTFMFVSNWNHGPQSGFAFRGVRPCLSTLLTNADVLRAFASTGVFRNYKEYAMFVAKHLLGYTGLSMQPHIIRAGMKVRNYATAHAGEYDHLFRATFVSDDAWNVVPDVKGLNWDNIDEMLFPDTYTITVEAWDAFGADGLLDANVYINKNGVRIDAIGYVNYPSNMIPSEAGNGVEYTLATLPKWVIDRGIK